MKLLGVVLAGGKSSRYGSDKAYALLEGRPLISHVLANLYECDQNLVVGREGLDIPGLEVTCIPDAPGFEGPIAGMVAAAKWAEGHTFTHLFVTSCDMIGLNPTWPRQLAKAAEPAAAIKDSHWQPMCSAWSLGEFLQYSARRKSSLREVLEDLGATAIAPPDGWDLVFGINSPQDMEMAKSRLHTKDS